VVSHKINNMALLGAALVVSIHVGISGPVHSFAWCLKEFIAEGIARIAVPYFFIVSGYFLGAKYFKTSGSVTQCWGEAWRKRVRTLLVPYWSWNLLYAPMIIGLELLSDKMAGRALRHVDWLSTAGAISGFDILGEPILFPLWYVKALFVLVVFSIVLWPLVSRLGLVVPMAFYAGHVTVSYFGATLPSVISLSGFAYFTLGMFLSRGFKVVIPRHASVAVVVVGLLAMCGLRWLWPEKDILLWWIPMILFGVWGIVPDRPWPKWLTSTAFPIYILHMFVLLVLQYAWHLTAFMPNGLLFLFRWCVAVGVSIFVARMLNRFLPSVAKILFGGRL